MNQGMPSRKSLFRTQRLRLIVQIAFFALVAALSVIRVLNEHGVALPPGDVSLHAICPFGGVVSLYNLITEGTFIQKIHESAMVLAALVLIIAVLFGPVFCGWFCPFGSLQEWLGKLGRRFFGKRYNRMVPKKLDRILGLMRYAVLVIVVYQTASSATLLFQNVDPYYALFNLFGEVSLTAVLALAAVLILSLFIERPFCKYACPYGALMGLTNFFRIFGIRRKASGCVQCKACDRACPMNIEVSASGTVRDVRCVSCLKCASSEGACPIPDTITMNIKEEK